MSLRLGFGVALVMAAAAMAPAGAAAQGVELAPFGGQAFDTPHYVTGPPDDPSRVFVVEGPGVIRLVKNGVTQPTPFLDINTDVFDRAEGCGECGLFSVAFAPDYATSGLFYVVYTRDSAVPSENHYIRLEEFQRSSGDPDVADPASRRIVFEIPHLTAGNHNGGQLHFGPDDLLYMSVGDGGSGSSGNGQRLTTQLGKLLRIDPAGDAPFEYSIPPDNPFADGPGGNADEIYSYGLRNPWRFSFDRATGDLTIGDVQAATREEIDFVPRGAGLGANFGWNCFEALHTFSNCNPPPANHTPPVLEYLHPDPGSASVAGGFVIRDGNLPSLLGRYVYADSFAGDMRTARLESGGAAGDASLGLGRLGFLVSFGEDACGRIYAADLDDGEVVRLEPAGAPVACLPEESPPDPPDQSPAPQGQVVGDFNADGFADLAVGAPAEDLGALDGAGAVNVIYGSAGGLTAAGDQFWHQNVDGIGEQSESGDRFGSSLAAGDLNGDGFDDLAIGAPGEDLGAGGSLDEAGAVNVIYGSATGLSNVGDQLWHQSVDGIPNEAESGDQFGDALAVGDLDGDGSADLAAGAPGEDLGPGGSIADAGVVNAIYGSAGGLSSSGSQLWHQDVAGIAEAAQAGDGFGESLAAGDLDGDGFADLAVGVPLEDLGGGAPIINAGAVNAIYGTASGLSAADDQLWSQDSPGIINSAETGDGFGGSLIAGDFGGDGFTDIAVGAATEDLGAASAILDAGAVNVISGGGSGLTEAGDQLWQQDSDGIANAAETNDGFGSTLAAADLDGDGTADLAAGVPGEDLGSGNSTLLGIGVANVIYGEPGTGLSEAGDQLWQQDTPGVPDGAEQGDGFGGSLAAGDLDGDGAGDLSLGVPFEDLVAGTVIDAAGAANVIYGAASGLGSAGSQLWHQDSAGIADAAERGDVLSGTPF